MYSSMTSLVIDAAEEEYLFCKKSQIEGAGIGLYTAIKIFKTEVIAIYKGELISKQEQEKRTLENDHHYFISLVSGRIMDSMKSECFAKYANDAEGKINSNYTNNAVITLNENDKVCLVALRVIKTGEEIFCSYGKEYWAFRK